MDDIIDFIVIGSGPTGAEVARTISDAGKHATMIDVGINAEQADNTDNDFLSIRENYTNQKDLFLGKFYESVPWGDIKTGAQLTPNRKFIIDLVDIITPIISSNFFPMESLAYGGLGSGWGLGCYSYSKSEIEQIGLNYNLMNDAYNNLAKYVGIASPDGDAFKYCMNNSQYLLPKLKMDNSISKLYDIYLKKREELNNKGLFMGFPPLAIITENHNDRNKCNYFDMDFYTDVNKHSYRPWLTTNKLIEKGSLNYISNHLVIDFKQDADGIVSVNTTNIKTLAKVTYKCRKLIIASGALGTARILLRSFKDKLSRLSLLSNDYTYMPCLNLKMLGKPLEQFKTSMAQAVMFYDPTQKNENPVSIALFTYRSLLLYKLIKESPLNFKDGLSIMNFLQSAFVIAGIHHPDSESSKKYCNLVKNDNQYTSDALFVSFSQKKEIMQRDNDNEKKLMSLMRKLYCFPIKRIKAGNGSSIHYAGILPFNTSNNGVILNEKGNINISNNVYIADGSGFKYLPAKGITFTLMANAHNVAKNAINS
ncbi:MAG: hypothetical protein A2X12_04165 [Bacteroidetes bacterium GWE2_29_8]|nr:MAG: hypothetical protein A2X12_04165 [Bacteroidetes bacterium GWE2_29_8]OFY24976.1 MAG: hypothetical protein A2X02_08010 [Bacteroidetes bacterium GWF2_29_10]